MNPQLSPFHKLTSTALNELADALAGTADSIPHHVLQQIAGSALAGELADSLDELFSRGWSSSHIAELAATIVETREQTADPESLFDIVLTGPDVPGVPTRDTAAVFYGLVEEAQDSIMLVGYAVYDGKKMFEHLAAKMLQDSQLKVDFLLNIQRPYRDTSLSSEIVRRFAIEFATKHWPWNPKPDIYYDPRSLESDSAKRASLHAKCVVVDKKVAIVTSANFTEAAHQRNIEAGVVVTYEPFVQRISEYFSALKTSVLQLCEIPQKPSHTK